MSRKSKPGAFYDSGDDEKTLSMNIGASQAPIIQVSDSEDGDRRAPLPPPLPWEGDGGAAGFGSTAPGYAADDPSFIPEEPISFKAAGLTRVFVEHLVLKVLLENPGLSGNEVAEVVALHPGPVRQLLRDLKRRMQVVHTDGAGADFCYDLTDDGRNKALHLRQQCPYAGPAPVTLEQYQRSVAEQSISREPVEAEDLKRAFHDLVLAPDLLELLGPAMTSGRGMFLFGSSGNGKTSIALRVIRAYRSTVYLPHAVLMNGVIVQLLDPQVHQAVVEETPGSFRGTRTDRRWVRCQRPAVVAGGELTLVSLEPEQIGPGMVEAPLQLKANCGLLVIDDFGRQAEDPSALLNRWILPLENRVDFLRMPNGRKVRVPFDPMLIFSTNLDPKDLVDEAFIRRIPYRLNVGDPDEDMFRQLLSRAAEEMGFPADIRMIDYVVDVVYQRANRPMRACHARDLLLQVRNRCLYRHEPLELTPQRLNYAARVYFTLL